MTTESRAIQKMILLMKVMENDYADEGDKKMILLMKVMKNDSVDEGDEK